jgi:hypothetical protein
MGVQFINFLDFNVPKGKYLITTSRKQAKNPPKTRDDALISPQLALSQLP